MFMPLRFDQILNDILEQLLKRVCQGYGARDDCKEVILASWSLKLVRRTALKIEESRPEKWHHQSGQVQIGLSEKAMLPSPGKFST